MNSSLCSLARIAAVVALCVVVLGAWVRLSHAGLGCPDWPGCYGKLTWPDAPHEIAEANTAFPDRPVDTEVAWREMVHRYLAGILVLLVVAINIVAWRKSTAVRHGGRTFKGISAFLLALILFQAALGMWTVTLKLLPVVVMGHLLGGFATLTLLAWLAFRAGRLPMGVTGKAYRNLRGLTVLALLVLTLQVALGGWTSANYSALACQDFPTCHGEFWPEMNFSEGFKLWREVGVDYEGGVLDTEARAAIHVSHRIGAVVTFLLLFFLALRLMASPPARVAGMLLALLVTLQVGLGIMNVVLQLPLANAVAHNAVAALLMVLLLHILHRGHAHNG